MTCFLVRACQIFTFFIATSIICLVAHAQPSWKISEVEGKAEKRHEAAFIEVNGKFYALGGRKREKTSIYNPKTNSWTEGAAPPFNIHHFQPVVYKNRIYMLGAMTGKFPKEDPVANVIIYDPKKDVWIIGDEIPKNRRRGGAGVALYNDKIYLVAGIQVGHWSGNVNWLDEYNPKTGEWKTLADAPRVRDHFQAVVIDGKLFAAGGRKTSKSTGHVFDLVTPEVDVYDFKNNSWSTLSNTLNIPTARAGASSVAYQNHLLVIGGESKQKIAHNTVEAYNIKNSQWKTLAPLARGRHGTGAFIFNKHLWTCCGSGNRGGRPELNSIESVKLDKNYLQQN